MNDRRNERKKNLRPSIIIGLIILAVAYHFSRPTLERWLNTSLPSLAESGTQTVDSGGAADIGSDYEARLPDESGAEAPRTTDFENTKSDRLQSERSEKTQSKTPARNNLSPGQAARNWLKDIGRNQYLSPAGLVYTGGREHRVDHVLRHCSDDPSKPTHGVFLGDAIDVMKMVDEAFELAKSGKANPKKSGDKTTYTVSMGRVVGHTGGQKAKRGGRKELRRIKLVLAENRVITAFPTN